MLLRLSISNFALIDSLEMHLQKGLTTVTGETGAGKSIILGALRLVLGERADLQSIKNTDSKCIVEAEFDVKKLTQIKEFCLQNDFDYEENTIIRREILPSGKSRAFLNDSPIGLKPLKHLGEQLIDIHSQYDTAEILNPIFALQLADGIAGNGKENLAYREKYTAFHRLQSVLKSKEETYYAEKSQQDYNRFLCSELDEVALKENEFETLEEEIKLLAHSAQMQEQITEIEQLTSNEEVGLQTALTRIRQNLDKLSGISEALDTQIARFNSAKIELEDTLEELLNHHSNSDNDPKRLAWVEERMAVINDLFRKHKVESTSGLLVVHRQLTEGQFQLETLEKEIADLKTQLNIEEKELRNLATKISKKRISVLPKIKSEIETQLADLGMPKSTLVLEQTLLDSFTPNGVDSVQILFSANEGIAVRALSQVASGGERSRLMLAIKHLVAKNSALPTLILDEIDTGVSGKIADAMGKLMQDMARHTQLIAITHLPQVAAKGDDHYKVYKSDATTQIKPLSPPERVREIAELISGETVSEAAQVQAKELLQN